MESKRGEPQAVVVDLRAKLALIEEQWTPKCVAALNDYVVKLCKLEGEFIWHQHDHTDELFQVLEGELAIDLPGSTVTLRAGELYVVPRGVSHRPRAEHECSVLVIEPAGTVNTGEAGGERTAPTDAWI